MCRLQLLKFMLMLSVAAEAAPSASPSNTLLPQCRSKCGNVTIPYPFGIGPGCHREGFDIFCNESYYPPRPFFGRRSNIEVIDISLLTSEVRVYKFISRVCYNSTTRLSYASASMNLTARPQYRFSDTRNKFTAIGCSTLAYILNLNRYASGCLSMCATLSDAVAGRCTGMGCCQTSIPKDLNYYMVLFDRDFKNTEISDFNPCSYGFLAEDGWFKFDASDLSHNFTSRYKRGVPLVLDWAIRNQTCEEAARNHSSYACISKNSICLNSTNGPGYFCNCSHGYQGNPYLLNGCQDINECNNPEKYSCYGVCTNVPGGFTCSCPSGKEGDPNTKDGCVMVKSPFPKSLKVVTGTCIGVLVAVIFGFWIYIGLEKRKLIISKRRFFEQNGGFILQQEINSHQGVAFKIYTKEELEKATNKFDQDRVIGSGGHGTVYKGVLEDQRIVAIKKSKLMDEDQIKEFAKEMFILSQINHKNVVKLLGCCLEVEVPMLVYEFISKGTLFQYIHDRNRKSDITLDTRLRIAMESAQALAYLHSSASIPIIHGDVKPSNILLDDNYSAKVSDFGASKLVPTDEAQLATLVQGTCGYLDPEYLQTCQLTAKSDVYSFGVVLVELLTGKKALNLDAPEDERSLVSIFISAIKENRLIEVLDSQFKHLGEDEHLKESADLAAECLNVRGEERPTMKEVADRLESLRKTMQHPSLSHNPAERESLLGELVYAPESTGHDSLGQSAVLSIQAGR